MTLSDILNRFSFFQQLPAAERVRATEAARLASLSNRGFFYHQGQRMNHFGLVGSGSIRVYRISESGREITLYHVREGETCLANLLAVLLNQEAYASAQAVGTVTAALLRGDLPRAWMRSSDTFRRFALDNMGQRLLGVMTLVEEVAFRKMDQRLAEFLRRAAAGQAQVVRTHEEIASELGTAREVVSRLLESLAQQDVISLRRGVIRVKRPDALRRAASGLSVTREHQRPHQTDFQVHDQGRG